MRIDVTDCDLREIIKAVYDLSSPQGMGFMHFDPEPLPDDDVDRILNCTPMGGVIVGMDYVKGRSCKFRVHFDEEGRYFDSPWYDHTDEQLTELVKRIGATMPELADEEHGCACNCTECRNTHEGA